MLEQKNSENNLALESNLDELTGGPGISESRRRLMRAGLAAAPVVMTLKSRSVLATTDHQCIKPSAFSSLRAAHMQLSRAPRNDYTCYSHGYWKTHDHPPPYTNKAASYFIAPPNGTPSGANVAIAGFAPAYGDIKKGTTLQQVLDMGNGGYYALARHLVGTFLTAVANGDNLSLVLLTTGDCRLIWSTLVGGGRWSPFTGANWDLNDTLAYFDYVYGPA